MRMSKAFSIPILLGTLLLLMLSARVNGQTASATDSTLIGSFHALAVAHDAHRGNPTEQATVRQNFNVLYSDLIAARNAGTKPTLPLYEEAIATARIVGLVQQTLVLLQLEEADHPHNSTECHCGKCHKD